MKLFKKSILYTIIIYVLLISRIAIGGEVKLSEHEAYILLDNLLTLSEENYNQKAQLARYKEWEKLYVTFSSKEDMTKDKMKIYLSTYRLHRSKPQKEIKYSKYGRLNIHWDYKTELELQNKNNQSHKVQPKRSTTIPKFISHRTPPILS